MPNLKPTYSFVLQLWIGVQYAIWINVALENVNFDEILTRKMNKNGILLYCIEIFSKEYQSKFNSAQLNK